MVRVLVEYVGGSIELPFGETVVGRDLRCQIRLNDPSVSRRHLRFRVGRDTVVVEDLKSRNGTTLNGARLTAGSELHDGDKLVVGDRTLRVRIVTDAAHGLDPETGGTRSAEESTGESLAAAFARAGGPLPPEFAPPAVKTHNCPQCRSSVAVDVDACPSCGYQWRRARPHAVTKAHLALDDVALEKVARERRGAPRVPVGVEVLYTSDSLSFEATARDLSRTGMFIATELLEPVGTPCRITVLLEGAPAVSFTAEVTRVVNTSTDDAPAGLATRFVQLSPEGERWLGWLLDRQHSSDPPDGNTPGVEDSGVIPRSRRKG